MIITSVEPCKNNNFNGQFAFINKHALNYDKREKSELTSIASHAAGYYYQKLKKHGVDRKSPSSTTSRDTSPETSRNLTTEKQSQRLAMPTILTWDTGITMQVSSKAPKRSTIRCRRQARAVDRECALPLSRAICLSNPDPFETFPCRMGPRTTELTQIWYRYFMNLCSPAGGSRRLESMANRAWQKHVRDIMEDRMQADAFFAGALAIKARFLAPATAKETWPEVYRLHTDALAGLRDRLRSESYSEAVLLTMFTVGSVNFYSGDWADNRKHSRAANRITGLLGGFDKLSDVTKDYMMEGCLNTSYCLMTRPRFYHGRWITEPWSSQPLSSTRPICLDNDSGSFNRSSQSRAGDDQIPVARLRSYFNAYREIVAVCKLAQSLGPDEVQDKDDIFTWLQGRRRTMRVQCLNYWCDLQDAIGNNIRADRSSRQETDNQILQDRLHQALVLGAFCFDAMYIHHQRCHAHALPVWLIYLPIPQLRKALDAVLQTMTGQGTLCHPEALLWLFFVGACAEEIARKMGVAFWPDDLELNCREWFVDMRERMGLDELEQIKEVLVGFIYEERFGDVYLLNLLQRW